MKKLLTCLLTMVTSLLLVFFVVQMIPGDPVNTLEQEYMTQSKMQYDQAYDKAKIALNYDPDEPVMTRFTTYVNGVCT